LIQQWLEEMVIVFINQRDLDWRFCEPARNFHPTEPRADNDDMGESFSVHDLFFLGFCTATFMSPLV